MKKKILILSLLIVLLVGGVMALISLLNLKSNKASNAVHESTVTSEKEIDTSTNSDRPSADLGNIDPKNLVEGDIAPDFTVDLYGGKTFKLSDYDDKNVIINFWATWCGPCVGEMPAFEKLKNDNNDNLEIVCINCMEDKKTVNQFIEENGYTFNIGYDESGRISTYYPTDGIPYTLIIKKGKISKIFLGAEDAETQYNEYKSAIEN